MLPRKNIKVQLLSTITIVSQNKRYAEEKHNLFNFNYMYMQNYNYIHTNSRLFLFSHSIMDEWKLQMGCLLGATVLAGLVPGKVSQAL